MTIGTLRQFARAMRDEYLAENPSISKAEYDREYPPESRLQDWVDALLRAGEKGETLSRYALDDLSRRAPHALTILRRYESSIPRFYLPPRVRTWNWEHEAEIRAARRLGRALGKEEVSK